MEVIVLHIRCDLLCRRPELRERVKRKRKKSIKEAVIMNAVKVLVKLGRSTGPL